MEATQTRPQALRSRLQRRLVPVIVNGVNTLLIPLLAPVVSLLVIRLASASLWGRFVEILLVVQFALHVIAWGNKEYLLRTFSQNPTQIAHAWQSSLLARTILLCVCSAILALIGYQPELLFWMILWLIGQALYQSFDALIAYSKAFGFAALAELAGLIILVTAIFGLQKQLSPQLLVMLFALVALAKAGIALLRFRRQALSFHNSGQLDRQFFRLALPFFFLGLSGMLQSRADLYSVGILLPDNELAHYQIYTSLLIYLQALPNIVLLPFVRSLYRLSTDATPKLASRLFLLGVVLAPVAMAAIHLLTGSLYHFQLPLTALVWGGLSVLPIYWYLPQIYALYRDNHQSRVLFVNLLGIAISLGFSIALIPGYGITGAVAASAIAQWAMLGALHIKQ